MRTLSINLAEICWVIVVVTRSIAIASDSEEQAIHDTYNAWVEASNERDIEKWLGHAVCATSHLLTSTGKWPEAPVVGSRCG